MPTELLHRILNYLHPIDRVCLGLASKRLLSNVLSSPPLTPHNWQRFLHGLAAYNTFTTIAAPEWHMLIPRLAHGWVPTERFRYCWRCHNIFPRCPEYWKGSVRGRYKARYHERLDSTLEELEVSRSQWDHMGKAQRLDVIVRGWCESKKMDSSAWYCESCRPKPQVDSCNHKPGHTGYTGLANSSAESGSGSGSGAGAGSGSGSGSGSGAGSGTGIDSGPFSGRPIPPSPGRCAFDLSRWPVECPRCIEAELTSHAQRPWHSPTGRKRRWWHGGEALAAVRYYTRTKLWPVFRNTVAWFCHHVVLSVVEAVVCVHFLVVELARAAWTSVCRMLVGLLG